MTRRSITDLLDRPEWFAAMYGLAAHRSHAAAAGKHNRLSRARDEALLLSLAAVAAIQHRLPGGTWPEELLRLDNDLFPAPDTAPVAAPKREARTPLPERYRIRGGARSPRQGRLAERVRAAFPNSRGGAQDEQRQVPPEPDDFALFLEQTVEPSALILLAGLTVAARGADDHRSPHASSPSTGRQLGDGTEHLMWDRAQVLSKLRSAVDDRSTLDPRQLADAVARRPELSGRSHYNLACFYAQASTNDQQPDVLQTRAREHLRAALAGSTGAMRVAMAGWARKDPTLRRAIEGWDQADAVLGPPEDGSSVEATAASRLSTIIAIGGYADELGRLGVHTAEALRRQTRDTHGVGQTADQLCVETAFVQRWADLLELLELDGIGITDLNLLDAAGIDTVAKLADAHPQRLHDQLAQVNRAGRFTQRVPATETLWGWIGRARDASHLSALPVRLTEQTSYEGTRMAKVSPFHSKLPGTQVYHDNDKCTVGNNIETYNKVSGTGGLRLCSDCARL